jgi:hypothetical protein
MPTLLRLLALASIISLSSCQSLEKVATQCQPFYVYTDETEKLIDADKSLCQCRLYRFSENYVGPIIGTTKDMPFSYCNKLIGNPIGEYAGVATFWEEVRRGISENSCY